MVEEMLAFFRVQLDRDPGAIFLVLSREPADEILATATANGVPRDRLVVRSASRADVPNLTAAADYGLFFIQPVFSKKASSPTKMGEFLALELPMVTNGEVGDVARIMAETGAGVVVEAFEDRAYRKALEELEGLQRDMERWREASRRWFDLQTGIDRYDAIYRSLIKSAAEERNRAG
jgi:hypothetical protein